MKTDVAARARYCIIADGEIDPLGWRSKSEGARSRANPHAQAAVAIDTVDVEIHCAR